MVALAPAPHPRFTRLGDDLVFMKRLSLGEAFNLGATPQVRPVLVCAMAALCCAAPPRDG